jgi:hypothetical protein
MWPSIRAILITLVLFFCAVEAAPLPTLKKRHMNRQIAQDETDRWVGILDTFGIEIAREELIQKVRRASRKSGKLQKKLIRPWRKLERPLGLSQSWGLFTFTDSYPGRMVIEARRGDSGWSELYRAPHDDGSALVALLHYRRVRGLWDDSGDRPYPGKLYNRWVTWLGARVFVLYPDVDAMRLRFDRVDIQPPTARRRHKPEQPQHERTRYREDYR